MHCRNVRDIYLLRSEFMARPAIWSIRLKIYSKDIFVWPQVMIFLGVSITSWYLAATDHFVPTMYVPFCLSQTNKHINYQCISPNENPWIPVLQCCSMFLFSRPWFNGYNNFRDMRCIVYDLKVMGLNPCQDELGCVVLVSNINRIWIKNKILVTMIVTYNDCQWYRWLLIFVIMAWMCSGIVLTNAEMFKWWKTVAM